MAFSYRSPSEEESELPLPIPEPEMLEVHRQLQEAIDIAIEAHRDQTDESGHAYILHPLRVMNRFRDPIKMMVAVLHDVLEDSACTPEMLSVRGIPDTVISNVLTLTKLDDDTYDEYIDNILDYPIATEVKIADIEDNGSFDRNWGSAAGHSEFYLRRLKRYRKAWNKLNGYSDTNSN